MTPRFAERLRAEMYEESMGRIFEQGRNLQAIHIDIAKKLNLRSIAE